MSLRISANYKPVCNTYRTVYKFYVLDKAHSRTVDVMTPYQRDELRLRQFGVIRSSRKSTKLTSYELKNYSVHDGIHCFKYKKDAEFFASARTSEIVVVSFLAMSYDFVASGIFDTVYANYVYTRLMNPEIVAHFDEGRPVGKTKSLVGFFSGV